MSDIKLFRTKGNQVEVIKGHSVAIEKSLQTLIEKNLETFLGIRLEVISKMVNWRSNPSWERANGPYRRAMDSGRTFVT